MSESHESLVETDIQAAPDATTRVRETISRAQARGEEMLVTIERRARARTDSVREELSVMRGEVKKVVERALVRLRSALDIPSRDEILSLAERLEEIDAKMQKLEEQRSADVKKLKRNVKTAKKDAKRARRATDKTTRSAKPKPKAKTAATKAKTPARKRSKATSA